LPGHGICSVVDELVELDRVRVKYFCCQEQGHASDELEHVALDRVRTQKSVEYVGGERKDETMAGLFFAHFVHPGDGFLAHVWFDVRLYGSEVRRAVGAVWLNAIEIGQ
jgi:hypothetical protein